MFVVRHVRVPAAQCHRDSKELSLVALSLKMSAQQLLKLVEENPITVGVVGATSALGAILLFRKPSMNRNSHDYDNQLTGSVRILNNADHTLKGGEFETSINDYEGMFSGARKEVGAITNEESVAVRTERYAAMINHFYNLVTGGCCDKHKQAEEKICPYTPPQTQTLSRPPPPPFFYLDSRFLRVGLGAELPLRSSVP